MLLCDTGVLLAAGNVKDHAHQACLRLLRHAEGPLLVPSPVLGEVVRPLLAPVTGLIEVPYTVRGRLGSARPAVSSASR